MKGRLIRMKENWIVFHVVTNVNTNDILGTIPFALHPDDVSDLKNNPDSPLKDLVGQEVDFDVKKVYISRTSYSTYAKIINHIEDELEEIEEQEEEDEEDDDYGCYACSSTGIGQVDGESCYKCGGKGVIIEKDYERD
jgi:hypothetical protein